MTTEEKIEEAEETKTAQGISFKGQESVAKFYQFFDVYHRMLKEAVEEDAKKPIIEREYGYRATDEMIKATVTKMRQGILKNKFGVNYDGNGFKKTCKHFGIKHTRKAIIEYLES
jgi:hypothetical protein